MIKSIKDKQLRHRIFQTSLRGIKRSIEEKSKELGIPIIYVNPKNTSKLCPLHNTPIAYTDNSRVERCGKNGELWHRDTVACWNLYLKALQGDGGVAPSLGGLKLDGSLVPLGLTATHEPIGISKSLWAR